ncbi:MAG: hypothetical protein H6710_00540 [Myxococcales bacterium]|nr:hypothetical protein [Myxococcales bacterium]MCB9703139.1 hypothetical protein [Myxococcales bacterium]
MRICPGCSRHLRADATTCPFCQKTTQAPTAAALALTLVAGVASVTLVGCTGDDKASTSDATGISASAYGGPPPGTTDITATTDPNTSSISGTAYGSPPPDSESGPSTTTTTDGSSSGTESSSTGTDSDTSTGTGTGTDSDTSSGTDTSTSTSG